MHWISTALCQTSNAISGDSSRPYDLSHCTGQRVRPGNCHFSSLSFQTYTTSRSGGTPSSPQTDLSIKPCRLRALSPPHGNREGGWNFGSSRTSMVGRTSLPPVVGCSFVTSSCTRLGAMRPSCRRHVSIPLKHFDSILTGAQPVSYSVPVLDHLQI